MPLAQKDFKNANTGKLRFVPDALPGINLSEVDIKARIKINGISVDTVPLAIEVLNESEARDLSVKKKHPLFYQRKECQIIVVEEGKVKAKESFEIDREVSNGLDLAKCIRLDLEPCIITREFLKDFEIVKEQLKIAMFLVNAKSIAELKKSSVFVV
ncbi:MAG: hypothetical protein KGH65_03005 [Candidatus Micrarchaeota archaeon]|nr:hypothetical protein [Candidatus Micrarchaeota archaeon]